MIEALLDGRADRQHGHWTSNNYKSLPDASCTQVIESGREVFKVKHPYGMSLYSAVLHDQGGQSLGQHDGVHGFPEPVK